MFSNLAWQVPAKRESQCPLRDIRNLGFFLISHVMKQQRKILW